MDALDRQILDELSYQCRVSFSKLAKKFDVSLNTIKNRVESLVEEGVIVSFVVQLNLGILDASFAIIILDIKPDTTKEDLVSLGSNPFIMALGIGYELDGFAIAVYRTNAELTKAIDFLHASNMVDGVRAVPLIALPPPMEPSSKGIESLKKVDWRILKSLSWDGRKSLGDVASEVGASVPTVRKRIMFMRKHGLIHETVQVNPAASAQGLVVMLRLHSPAIIQNGFYETDTQFKSHFSDEYWISFRSANEAEVMATFVVDTSKRVATLRSDLMNLIQDGKIEEQVIVPEWIFFPDFRNDLIDKHLNL